jgi:hypothetical protein
VTLVCYYFLSVVAAYTPPQWGTSVTCVDHAWWAIVPFPVKDLVSIRPADISLGPVPPIYHKYLPNGTHPVIFEMGHQQNCHWVYLPFFKSTFHEFKMEIPFCSHKRYGGPIMYKPVIYEDNFVDRIGSRVAYGLPTFPADFNVTNSSYTFTLPEKVQQSFGAVFTSKAGFSHNVSSLPFFKAYMEIY